MGSDGRVRSRPPAPGWPSSTATPASPTASKPPRRARRAGSKTKGFFPPSAVSASCRPDGRTGPTAYGPKTWGRAPADAKPEDSGPGAAPDRPSTAGSLVGSSAPSRGPLNKKGTDMGAPLNRHWDELTRAASICLRAWAVRLLSGMANDSAGGQGNKAAKQIVSEAQEPPST